MWPIETRDYHNERWTWPALKSSYHLRLKDIDVTNKEKTEREIKETIPFTIATKRIKHLGVYLPKETKDLYIENYKMLMKEIKEHKQMEKYTMFMDWKNQYCQNDYTTQSNL